MKYIYVVLISLFIVSCSQESKKSSKKTHDSTDELYLTEDDIYNNLVAAMEEELENDELASRDKKDTLIVLPSYVYDSVPNENIITVLFEEDGPDFGWLAEIVSGNELIDSAVVKCINLIPSTEPRDTIIQSLLWFLTMDMHFVYDESLKNYSGFVHVFNDTAATRKLGFITMYKGRPHGKVVVYNKQGKPVIVRNYYNGTWLSSDLDIASVDWHFNAHNSNIIIRDLERAGLKSDSDIVKILPSKQPRDGYNPMYQIIDKETFLNTVKINGQVFTGTLICYYEPSYSIINLTKHFSLEIVNGKLDGLVEIYDEWGELTLKEVFEEGELIETIFQADEEGGVAKPIIYIYPTDTIKVKVSLDFEGRLTHTYPQYQTNGWDVTAFPDGTLIDSSGLEYYSLFWEGSNDNKFSINEGNVILGSQTRVFLEKSLATLGLNRREANEFIIYWLPLMENNKYNLIHFSSREYEEMAQLNIAPKPETLIRVMMVWKPLSENIDISTQDISALSKKRKGFTVVEWGGKKLSEHYNLTLLK